LYPFVGGTGPCKTNEGSVAIKEYVKIQGCDDLARALVLGPVAVEVAIVAWMTYSGGILDNCPGDIGHAALLVGMTDKYWRLKNSFGSTWGESGFIRISRGNTCQIC
jgi:C1A family cysteine protease